MREVVDRLLDLGDAHLPGRVRVDRGLEGRGGDDALVKPVAAGMQKLQRDFPARVVHGKGNGPVMRAVLFVGELGAVRAEVAGVVRRIAAGHDQRRTAARALRVQGGERREVAARLEARVHRAHEHAVAQRGEAEVERLGDGKHALDPVWRGPTWLPTIAEIRDPQEWMDRVRLSEELVG